MTRIYDGDKHVALEAEKTRLQTEISAVATRMNDEYESDAWTGEDAPGKVARYSADNITHMRLSRELEAVEREIDRMEAVRPISRAELNANPLIDIRRRWCAYGGEGLDEGERQTFMPNMSDEKIKKDLEARGIPAKGEFFDPWALATDYSDKPLPASHMRRGPRMADGAPSRSDITTSNDGSALGAAAPETWAAGVVESLQFFGSVAANCHNFNTSDGNKFHQNTLDTKDEIGELIVDQSTAAGTGRPQAATTNINDAGDIVFDSYWVSSKFVEARIEAFQDIHFDVAGRIMREMERRIGRGWNLHFTMGGGHPTGSTGLADRPQGIAMSALRVDGKAGSADDGTGGIDYQNLIDMEYAIDLAYLEGGEGGDGGFMDAHGGMVGWMMHRNVEKQLRLATLFPATGSSATSAVGGLPVWVPDPTNVGIATQRAPGRILGYPYTINNHMGTGKAATDYRENSNKSGGFDQDKQPPLLFGACGHFAVRNIGGPMYYRFWDSNTAANMGVRFIGWSRRDSRSRGPHLAARQVTNALDGYATASTTIILNDAYCALTVKA